ncbi:Protein-glutamate methylesterase/protein-glutamine glutaminase [Moorella humiferrea]
MTAWEWKQTVNLPVKVLVVDDSAFIRRVVGDILANDPEIQVVGTARNGKEALEKASLLAPDVITLDVEMPVMDGLETLEKLMAQKPVAVIMLSAHTEAGAVVTLRALELGAVDFVLKPQKPVEVKELAQILPEKVKAAARIPPRRLCLGKPCREIVPAPLLSAGMGRFDVVAVGTSTGGPAALQQVLTRLPADFPIGIVIVQHMPPGFTAALARRLNELSALEIREAQEGDVVAPGVVLIAPAGKQMVVERKGSVVRTHLTEDAGIPTIFKPSADVLFLSVATVYGKRSLGVILTGMGNDGLRGLRAIKEQGGMVLAQDEETSIVYGMPRAAVEAGLADRVLPLPAIAGEIVSLVTSGPPYSKGENTQWRF